VALDDPDRFEWGGPDIDGPTARRDAVMAEAEAAYEARHRGGASRPSGPPGDGELRTLDGAEALALLGSPLPGVVEFVHHYGSEG
jgi:hypothetical protein